MARTEIAALTSNQQLNGDFFLLVEKELCQKKSGENYLRLVLGDGERQVKAVMWENFSELIPSLKTGAVVKIQGIVRNFKNEIQVNVQRIREATAGEPQSEEFLPRSRFDVNELLLSLEGLIDTIHSPYLRNLLASFYRDEETRKKICQAPAGRKLHHNTVGGLLEHTVTVTRLCEQMCLLYPELKRDLLIAAALLHDIGKLVELDASCFDYSDEGRLLGHLFLGGRMVLEHSGKIQPENEFEKMELLHAMLAHHGTHEWGSPIVPMTLEAIALHYADNLDAKIAGFKNWSEINPDPARTYWSKYWSFMERYIYRRPLDAEEQNHPLGDEVIPNPPIPPTGIVE
jgi:3'-5' exoribonuclease